MGYDILERGYRYVTALHVHFKGVVQDIDPKIMTVFDYLLWINELLHLKSD